MTTHFIIFKHGDGKAVDLQHQDYHFKENNRSGFLQESGNHRDRRHYLGVNQHYTSNAQISPPVRDKKLAQDRFKSNYQLEAEKGIKDPSRINSYYTQDGIEINPFV